MLSTRWSALGEPFGTSDSVTDRCPNHSRTWAIDNGGFSYFFENDLPGNSKYSLFSDAYRRIGAERAADLLDLEVKLFPFDDPHLSQEKRNEYMDSLDESEDRCVTGKVCHFYRY